MKTLLVAGARPNFMKLAPIADALVCYGQEYKIVHTGQHYDDNMSKVFFDDLNIREPDYNLEVGSETHARQTAKIIHKFADVCEREEPDVVIVIGDVNSTLACAVVASKLEGVKLAHVEAGERSFDKTMPEEINRIVTDVLSDYLFCATDKAMNNLINEGCHKNKIYLVGNVAMDSLIYNATKLPLRDGEPYILCTIHRQSNTDDKKNLKNILKALITISEKIKIIFPMHPRTVARIKSFGLTKYLDQIDVIQPLNYLKFIYRMKNASVVLTDSGGIQVETTVLGVPCITLRENTEWGFTLIEGTNRLVGVAIDKIINETFDVLAKPPKSSLSRANRILLDGMASKRIVKILVDENIK